MTYDTNTTIPTAFPALAAPAWHDLLDSMGSLGQDPAIRAAFAQAYRAGMSVDEFCGLQLDPPARTSGGPRAYFGVPHGPYLIFTAEEGRTAYLPEGRDWPEIPSEQLVAWGAELDVLEGIASTVSRAAMEYGDIAAEPYMTRRQAIVQQILEAPCDSRTAAMVKGRIVNPCIQDSCIEDVVFGQILSWIGSDYFVGDVLRHADRVTSPPT